MGSEGLRENAAMNEEGIKLSDITSSSGLANGLTRCELDPSSNKYCFYSFRGHNEYYMVISPNSPPFGGQIILQCNECR